jgi:hypothetical protein
MQLLLKLDFCVGLLKQSGWIIFPRFVGVEFFYLSFIAPTKSRKIYNIR